MELAALAHYSRRQWWFDLTMVGLFFAAELVLSWKLFPWLSAYPFVLSLAMVLGYIGADFLSGFVHWLGDTWGNPSLPWVGQTFIRPFREHHVDPTAITRHDFVQTNGSNCAGALLVVGPCAFADLSMSGPWQLFFMAFLTALAFSVFLTNQFHKWAHQAKRNRFVRWLQRAKLILSPEHHGLHHARPFSHAYCITTGWLNPLLEKIRFFRGLEWLIEKVTGNQARANDQILTEL